jgi:hypothetical protein
MYSYLDTQVVAQFNRRLGGSDSALDRAFALLSQPKQFVEFYKSNLLCDPPQPSIFAKTENTEPPRFPSIVYALARRYPTLANRARPLVKKLFRYG